MNAENQLNPESQKAFNQLKAGHLGALFYKFPPDERDKIVEALNKYPPASDMHEKTKKFCENFLETEHGSDKNTMGYIFCCEWLSHCGMSGWIIFLIILLVIGCLAAAGAAFWFFYWRRKMGGRDIEKDVDSEKSSTKSEYDISVDTY